MATETGKATLWTGMEGLERAGRVTVKTLATDEQGSAPQRRKVRKEVNGHDERGSARIKPESVLRQVGMPWHVVAAQVAGW
jgi:hypothetical protein